MQEVVKEKIIKWLDAGVLYPIMDNSWESPVKCVPIKGGMTRVQNEKGQLISKKLVTKWQICMHCKKLCAKMEKDHFPLPFMDQILDRLAGKG